MIKIAFIIDTIESPTAGTEKQLLMLIKHLDRAMFQPYLCVLRTSKWLEKEFELCPLLVVGIDSFKNFRGLHGIWTLADFLKSNRIDIVQLHFRDSSIAGVIAAKLAGIKVVIGTRRNQGYWLTPFEMKIQKFLDKWISIYIANSQSTKQWVIDNEGVDCKRIEVISNGFDLSKFPIKTEDMKKQIRASLGIPLDASVVVIVANLRPVKDHMTFLKAAQIVHLEKPDVHFLVVGSGAELQKLRNESSSLGIAGSVHFLGERLDVSEILTACDIGVLSSISESFSNALVEYMAAGLPVVTTDVGGASEALVDGVNGYIVPVKDSYQMGKRIVELLKSELIQDMGQEGRRICLECFSLPNMIGQSVLLYFSLIDKRLQLENQAVLH
jgi:L-malate glycosyltransferase